MSGPPIISPIWDMILEIVGAVAVLAAISLLVTVLK